MLDIATRLVPFISHNDVTRVQMASTQAKQVIPLINAEIPFIRTGFEETYLDYSSYLYRAKDDGKVIYKDTEHMVIKYDNLNTGEVINLGGPYGNREGFEKILFTNYNLNDSFTKDTIIARTSSISEDGFLSLGSNLKTTYISCPYNYKDAVVISESCAQKLSTRIIYEELIDCADTIPIVWNNNDISYPQGTYVNKADPIFIMKERSPNNPMHIVSPGDEIYAPVSGRLYYKVIVDEVIKTQKEEIYYNKLYENDIKRQESFAEAIRAIHNQDDLHDKLISDAYINYYCPQINKHRSGRSLILIYYIVQECPVIVGCKLCNRHGKPYCRRIQ